MLDLNLPNREYRIDLLECRFYIRHLFRYSPGLVPMKSVNFSFRFFFNHFNLRYRPIQFQNRNITGRILRQLK